MTGYSMTTRERRGRLWLAVFSGTLALLCVANVVATLLSLNQAVNLWRGIGLPVAQLWLLPLLWTGERWTRLDVIAFYLFDGGAQVFPLLVASAAAWDMTQPSRRRREGKYSCR